MLGFSCVPKGFWKESLQGGAQNSRQPSKRQIKAMFCFVVRAHREHEKQCLLTLSVLPWLPFEQNRIE